MQRFVLLAGVAAMVVLPAVGVAAQTSYDLADYFMLTPGLWRVDEDRRPGNPTPHGKYAFVVTTLGQFTLQNGFRWNGTFWEVDEVEIYEVTATHLVYHGAYHPVKQEFLLLTPPLRVPRQQKLHVPFTYKGTAVATSGSTPFFMTAVLTADQLTRKTKAGTFTGCIRLKTTIITNDTLDCASEIRAKKLGFVASVDVYLDETEPESQMVDPEISERVQPLKP